MKKPYLTKEQRESIRCNTTIGAFTMVHFRIKQLEKAIIQTQIGSIFYKFLHNVIKRLNDL